MTKTPGALPAFVECDECGHDYVTDDENDFSFCPECGVKNYGPNCMDDAGPCCLGEAYGSDHDYDCYAKGIK